MGHKEYHVEGYFVKKATDMGAMVRKLQWVNRRGGLDRFVALYGFLAFIEFKSPEGKLSKAQIAELEIMRHHGIKALVVSSREEADAVLAVMSYVKAGGLRV